MASIDIFPWNDHFDTGITLIDEQHRKLGQLLNLLAHHVAIESPPLELEAVFHEMLAYARHHFECEEKLWGKYLPDDALEIEHRQEHSDFIEQVLTLKAQNSAHASDEVIREVLSFLNRWLASHMLETDRHLSRVVLALEAGMDLPTAKAHAHEQMRGATRVLIDIILSIYETLGNNTLFLLRQLAERQSVEQRLSVATAAIESPQGTIVTDAQRLIVQVNTAFTRITGYNAGEVLGKNPNILKSGRHGPDFYTALWDDVHSEGTWSGEVWSRRKNGEVYPEHLTISSVKNADNVVTNYIGSFSDITVAKAAEQRIEALAYSDHLTGLPNRALLADRLQQALVGSARTDRMGALLLIDLDDFNTLNDTLGHDTGDLLLRQTSERLGSCVREGDTVARQGGDEFVVVLENLSEDESDAAAQTEAVATKIVDKLAQPFDLAGQPYHGGACIGLVLFKAHLQSAQELLKQADIAMHQAKKVGRKTMRFFDPRMQEVVNLQAGLENDLRRALEQKQFELHYQIQVDSAGKALGAEALIRWDHPQRGQVAPINFIPLAETSGLILPIGQWVLETACAQLARWQQVAGTRQLTLAVNVSARQFLQADFVSLVERTVRQFGIDATRLKLELTESILLHNITEAIATMQALKVLGIKFSLDDFGTGYSSLQYLKSLPLDQLKIDRSFVNELATDASDRAIVRTIIAMARSLELNVIAEGVETQEQRDLLLGKGCAAYQGYLFGRPVPIEQWTSQLELP